MDAYFLLPLVHRCLQLSDSNDFGHVPKGNESSTPPCDGAFSSALRHAIILFLAPIRRWLGPPALGTDLHVTKLISALQSCLIHPATLQLQQLVFWMLVVGALEASHLQRKCQWFFSHIVDGCAILGAKRFEDVQRTVKHAMTQSVWLEDAMSPNFELMMKGLRVFMEELSTIGFTEEQLF
jgi:hypothetical protein